MPGKLREVRYVDLGHRGLGGLLLPGIFPAVLEHLRHPPNSDRHTTSPGTKSLANHLLQSQRIYVCLSTLFRLLLTRIRAW